MLENAKGFIDFFRTIPDHRIERKKLYPLEELLLIAFCGVMSGCDGWDDFEVFGETKLELLRQYLPFTHGAPSDDTLRRFFRALDPACFETCFQHWIRSFQIDLTDKVVAIDGKSARRSVGEDGAMFHMISAYASEAGLVLGQLKVDGKSNEITANPPFLEMLDIAGATITLDAMGCQTKVVEKIIERKANYLIGLKGNQGTLNEDVRLLFEEKPNRSDSP